MNGCEHEKDVLRAMRDDDWNDALRAHVATCDECSAAVDAAAWMNRFAALDDREHVLPNPTIVWLKSQILQQSRTVDRATRPMNAVQLAAYVLVAGGWAAMMMTKWQAIQAWISSVSPSHVLLGASDSGSLSITFFAVVLILTSATVMLALHTILAEE
jgi:hypothetical protein